MKKGIGMSFMKRMLSSIGIGAAQVDTQIEDEPFAPGETMDALVTITGGQVETQVDDIYFSLYTNYEEERDDQTVSRTALLDKIKLRDRFVLAPEEQIELPVSIQLPWDTPLTLGKTKVWVQTGLDVKHAIDPGDTDHIQVVPDVLVGSLFEALESLGFTMVEATCEGVANHRYGERPFAQEFEFKPVQGPFAQRLDELEIVYFQLEDGVEVLLEVDRKARGLRGLLAELTDTDESHVRFVFGEADIDHLADHLYDVIAELT